MNLVNEMLEHLLGHGEVCNHAVFKWPDRLDVAGSTSEHTFGVCPHRRDGFGV